MKRFHYQLGAALAYRKNGSLGKKSITDSVKTGSKFKDPIEIIVFITKIFAFIGSLVINPWEDSRYCNKKLTSYSKN